MDSELIKKLSSVLKPIGQASGLPNEYYIDEDIFNFEKKWLLFNHWSGIGFGKDIPNVGDAQPVDFLGTPLLLVRDETNNVRVFENICRHRGMLLIQKKTTLSGTIRCPYHSWCYSLNGELRATPHVGGPGNNIHPEIKRRELSLNEIKSEVWHDVIFVNVSNNVPSFRNCNLNLLNRWQDFEQPLYHSGADSTIELEINCNWKLAVENYCESYHLPWIHPSLNSYSKIEDHYNIEQQGEFSGQGSTFYTPLKSKTGQRFRDFNGLSKKWDTGSEYIALFPNVLFGVHRDHTFAIILLPISTSKTLERIKIHYSSEVCLSERFKELRKKNRNLWKSVFEEDIFVIEGMQKGREGTLFDGGKFSPVMDAPTYLFHEWVAKNIIKFGSINVTT